MKSLLPVLAFALMFGLVGVASAQDPCWIGGTSGSLPWDDAENWEPNEVPDSVVENAIIDNGTTGDRDITTPATATTIASLSWIADGDHEDKLILGNDLTLDSANNSGWSNTGEPNAMVLNLNTYTFITKALNWDMPNMTVTGTGTFEFTNGLDANAPLLFDPTVTIVGASNFWAGGATIPNLTVKGDLAFREDPLTISGDVQVDAALIDL